MMTEPRFDPRHPFRLHVRVDHLVTVVMDADAELEVPIPES
jgi:hypothetical protein